ncbi:hypothetical protein GCM10023063_15180 [Arthrobacter methylotrophus]
MPDMCAAAWVDVDGRSLCRSSMKKVRAQVAILWDDQLNDKGTVTFRGVEIGRSEVN